MNTILIKHRVYAIARLLFFHVKTLRSFTALADNMPLYALGIRRNYI